MNQLFLVLLVSFGAVAMANERRFLQACVSDSDCADNKYLTCCRQIGIFGGKKCSLRVPIADVCSIEELLGGVRDVFKKCSAQSDCGPNSCCTKITVPFFGSIQRCHPKFISNAACPNELFRKCKDQSECDANECCIHGGPLLGERCFPKPIQDMSCLKNVMCSDESDCQPDQCCYKIGKLASFCVPKPKENFPCLQGCSCRDDMVCKKKPLIQISPDGTNLNVNVDVCSQP